MKTKLFIATGALAAMGWAATDSVAAHFIEQPVALVAQTQQPAAASFQVDRDKGLLLQAWINGAGPYLFVIDTGAGMNVISQRLVNQLRLETKATPATIVGGLSSARVTSNREAVLNKLSVGRTGNLLAKQSALVVSNLPIDIDGILDPTEAYGTNGYWIDMPNAQIGALEPSGLIRNATASERATVPWIRKAGDNRPFVRLGDGRLALIDTGSAFGLAVNERNAVIIGSNGRTNDAGSRDISGGLIRSRRVQPTTISIGELVLRRIPTDVLFGVHKNSPTILGRDALYPFKISFDRKRGVIEFVATGPND